MGQTPPPDEVTRRQPHPTPGLMGSGFQYHRGAVATPPPHYRRLSGGHEHTYANISWHEGPHAFSRPMPAPRAVVQRYLDYAHAGPSDYVNHLPPFHHQALTAGYLRPAPQEWTVPVTDTSYPARQLSYTEDEVRATTVPHPNPSTRQQHHATGTTSMVPYSTAEPLCQAVEQLHVHVPDHQNHITGPLAPPLTQAPTLAPVASLLNHANSTVHVNAPHELAQTPPHWPTANPDLAQSYQAQLSTNTSSTLVPAVAVADHGNLPTPGWGMLDAQVGSSTFPIYGQVQQGGSEWSLAEAALPHQHVPNIPTPAKPKAQPQRRRARLPKKSLKRVPATYKERRRKSKTSKREGPLCEASRMKTHKMRKNRLACVRCRFYKSGCDEGEICEKCTKVMGNTRSYHLPCRRDNIIDTHLVRHCHGRLSQEEGEFLNYDWMLGSKLYGMDIQWILPGYGPISSTAPLLRITYREYYPNKNMFDTTVSVWRNVEGSVEVVEQPAYAIYDTAKFMATFEQYFSGMQSDIEGWIFNRVRNDEIAWRTYHEVRRLRDQKPRGPNNLLDLAMRIQCLSVVSQGYGTIVTPNVPGVREYDFGKMGRSTYEAYDRRSRERPLTAAINHQMDVAALKYLRKLEKECAKQLNKQIFSMKTKPWYEIFLALYVLFWNLEYIHSGAERYMSAKSGTAIQHQVSSVISNQLKKWDFTFDVLMYHWLIILRDFKPLMLARENPEELRLNGHVDGDAFLYLVRLVELIDQNKFGRSTAPYVGYPATHDSLSSVWISTLFNKAASDDV